ncbi:Uncharacterized protein BM_BM2329 [Brugia malayi]|uniref:Uncharacterized protein n=1 Tax=Brugia malayi TaxID=6279 RepID=A0A4E9EZS0_BRUMA|nr:Uncharacterized protein BM_BM2329 [Brugia malayi]VIO88932.1 Uncharacterized protein BM_BM2329 [Brugia malayi]
MWWPILPALLLHSHASFYAVENGPQLSHYDSDKQIATLMHLLTQTNKGRRQSSYNDEYSESESNVMYDINIENAENAPVQGTAAKLITTQKKGQSEYVGFIEPVSNQINQIKHREMLKKRVEDQQMVQQTNLRPMLHLGNFLTLAVATACMLAVVIGIATGSYYFFKDRSQKSPADSCDFTYAPTGPGKSRKKKGGDEGLAYKAQLHHYQQAKQKIISGEDGTITLPDGYESSETSDDENNFSVYECPGLAPTGDIENIFNVLPSCGIELPDVVDLHIMKCLSDIREVEKCINIMVDCVDTWRNLSAQLEATRKMPRYTSLMLHSSSWQPGLMARIELEIDAVASKLSEQWKHVEEITDMLNNFVAAECQSQKTTQFSFLRQDLQHLLSYLVVEVMKWYEIDNKVTCPAVIASIKPNVDVVKAIARCMQSLETTVNHMSKKS